MNSRPPRRRAWTWAQGIPLLVAALTVAGVVAAVAWTTSQPRPIQMLALAGVLMAGAVCFVGARSLLGTPAVRRRVTEARREWARARQWTYAGVEPAADSDTVALVLPRGWKPPLPLGSMHGTFHGRRATVQTWELRSAVGSTRQTTHRELVVLSADTRGHRCAVVSATQVDPALLRPAWVNLRRRPQDAPGRLHANGDPLVLDTWGPAITRAMEGHDDLPLIVAAGMDRVVIMALDDPRPAATDARLELARMIAETIDPVAPPR